MDKSFDEHLRLETKVATLGKWRSTTGEATTFLSSSEKQSTLSPKTSSVTRYMLQAAI